MTWRINTRAEEGDSRHFDAGWIEQAATWKPSTGYIPRPVRDGWTAAQLVVAVLLGSAAVVAIALAIGGAA
jgi:hypothetical protein